MAERSKEPKAEPQTPFRRPEWGAFRGAIELADDFNDPVPEIERAFAGDREIPPKPSA